MEFGGGKAMRSFLMASYFFVLPAVVYGSSLSAALDAKAWAFEEATCEEVRGLFRVDTESIMDVPELESISLLFVSVFVQGYAAGSEEKYSSTLRQWGEFCAANPTSKWRDFLDPR
jgi:hypothetical protein